MMTSTNSPTITTEGVTGDLSTSNVHSFAQSSANTLQQTTETTAAVTNQAGSISTEDAGNMTTTNPPTAVFSTTDSSKHTNVKSSTDYSVTADDNSTTSSNTTAPILSGLNASTTYDVTTDVTVSSQLPHNSASTAVVGLVKTCPDPSPISGGKILSTGPYVANVSSAVYSCVAGLTLTGQSKIGCNITGTWEKQPPSCVPINRQNVDNHISLDDSTRVPLWMTIVLCVAFGLLCLLLLACLLMYCLKIFGYCKGSTVGAKLVVRERGVENGDVNRRQTFADDFGSANKYDRPKHVSYEENDERSRRQREQGNIASSRIPVKYTGQNGLRNGPYNQINSHTVEGPTTGKLYRREAKMPSKETWMPHSRNYRNINTSTK